MFQLLKCLFRLFNKDTPAVKKVPHQEVTEMDRLSRACASDHVDPARRAPTASWTAPLPDRLAHNDEDQKLSNDTLLEISLKNTSFVDAKEDNYAAEGPSLLDQIRNKFQALPSLPVDLRASRRYPCDPVHCQLKVLVGPSMWPARVKDLSTSGVGFVFGQRHQPGTSLQLTITNNSRGITCDVLAQVVRVVLLPTGQWLTCCAFGEPLENEELKRLL